MTGKGMYVARIVADLAGVEISVFVQLSAGDGAIDRRTGGALVGVEVAAGQRLEARLHVHVLTAPGRIQDGDGRVSRPQACNKTHCRLAPGAGDPRG